LGGRKPCGQFWLIDPLDGTKEFTARNDEFTVNVALIEEGREVDQFFETGSWER
jgi:3'(2'), 5'-bisphosphate nucleotidase